MITVRSGAGDGAGLAMRLHRDGWEVRWSPKERDCDAMLKGIIRSGDVAKRSDLVIFDSLGFGIEGDSLRKLGTPTIGSNKAEKWESERDVGLAIMAEHDITLSQTHAFTRLWEAEKFLEKHGGEWYFKPDGEVPKSLTCKGDAESLLRFLAWARPQLGKVPRFVLQAPAPKGIEIDVAAWIDGHEAVAYEVTIEEKKFLTGNHGPALGCSSNVVWEIPSGCALVARTLGPFVNALVETGYVGIAALNTIITPSLDVYGLEWTMRTGWDSTQASCVLFDETLGDQLIDFAKGNLARFNRSPEAGMTLRLSLPPLPVADSKDTKRNTNMPLPDDLLDQHDVWLEDVALRDGHPVLATGSGFLGCAVTRGTAIDAMRKSLVHTAEGLDIPDLMFRVDPVSRLEEAVSFLRKHRLCPDPLGTLPKDAKE